MEPEHMAVCCWPTLGRDNDLGLYLAFTLCVLVSVKLGTSQTPAPQGVWSRLSPRSPPSVLPSTENTGSHNNTHTRTHVSAAMLIPLLCKRQCHRDSHQPTCQPPPDQLSSGQMQTRRRPSGEPIHPKGRRIRPRLCSVASFWIQNKCGHSTRM